MILGKVISGPVAGEGLGAYQEGTDFNCNSTICYGLTKPGEQKPGAVHTSFLNLQRAINRWSGKARFTPIDVDGKIGHSTVTALQKAGVASLSLLPIGLKQVAQQMFSSSLTKENTAFNALALAENLNAAADKLEAAGAMPPPLPAPNAPRPVQQPVNTSPASLPQATQGSSSMLYWVLGGFAVVATAGLATAVLMKRKPAGRKMRRRAAA